MSRVADSDEPEETEDAPLVSPEKPGLHQSEEYAPQFEPLREVLDLIRLAFPIFISRISSTLKNVTDTAILGHIDSNSRFLLASALGDMWMQSTGCIMNGRVLGVFCGESVLGTLQGKDLY